MDPEFRKLLEHVAIVGGVMGLIGMTIIVFAVRAFRAQKQMTSFAGPLLIVVVLGFIMICCLLLLRLSFPH